MVMEDFEDVVLPHSRERILDYYRRAQAIEWVKPDPELVRDSKTGDWKIYKPQSMSTKLKRFFTDLRKNPENKDVVQTWEKNWLKQQGMIEDAMGEEWPGVCITHVPFEKALFYACRDSDATRRLLPLIQRMSSNVRKRPQELWRD